MTAQDLEHLRAEIDAKCDSVATSDDLADLIELFAMGVEKDLYGYLDLESYLSGVTIALLELKGMYKNQGVDIETVSNWEQIADALCMGFEFA